MWLGVGKQQKNLKITSLIARRWQTSKKLTSNSWAHFYRGLNSLEQAMKKLQKYVKDIEEAAYFFQRHFIGKKMIYSTASQSISIQFEPYHFSHLCGIKYNDGAKQFFKAVMSKKLDLSKAKINETTELKLIVLKSIRFIISEHVQLTENAFYLHLDFDKAIKTNKLIFALTLKFNHQNELFPNSLLNLKTMKGFPKGEKVISIKSIDLLDGSEIVYL